MNYATLKTEVQANLGRSDTTTIGYIETAINYVLTEDLPRRGLRPHVVTSEALATTASQEYVDISSLTGFQGFVRKGVAIEDGDDWTVLTPMEESAMLITDEGKPAYHKVQYSAGSARLYLRDIPDDAYDLRLKYYAKQAALSGDSDEAYLSQTFGDMPIIAGATSEVALKLGIMDVHALWSRRYEREVMKVMQWQYDLEGSEPFMSNIYT